MIKIKNSANRAIGIRSAPKGGTLQLSSRLGTTSVKKKVDDEFVSTSSSPVTGMGANTSVSGNPITIDLEPMLTGITPQIEQAYFYRLYRDIYYQDPVAGSAVDMISSLPFSEFSLGGISDSRALSVFLETIERLNLRTMMPEMCVDYLVLGQHVSSLMYNKEKKLFTDIMPHAVENLTIEPLPFYSQDPIITARFPDNVKNILNRDTPRIRRLKENLGSTLIDKILGGTLELEPLSTLYIPRKTFSHSAIGTSYYRRILPIYLIEKNLFRGTLVESARRQRGIMHITLGDGDQWDPSVQDLEFITELFMNADSDPLGAIIATKLGVSTEELRCIAGDTLVSTDSGLIPVQCLGPDYRTLEPGTTVEVNFRAKGLSGRFEKVSQWHYQGQKPTIKLFTETGTRLCCTVNHKLLTVDSTGELVMMKAGDSLNHYVLKELGGRQHKTAGKFEYADNNVNYQNSDIGAKCPKKMTPDLAYVLGIIVSEGCINGSTVQVANTDTDLLTKYTECCEKVFGKKHKVKIHTEECDRYCFGKIRHCKEVVQSNVCSAKIVDCLHQLGVKRSTHRSKRAKSLAYYKQIPWSILQADEESRYAFIAAYVDGDGSVIVNSDSAKRSVEIRFFSRSSSILRTMQTLLADMGYMSTWDPFEKRQSYGYRLSLNTGEASRLFNRISRYLSGTKNKFEICDDVRTHSYGIPADVFIPLLQSRYLRMGKNADKQRGCWFMNDSGQEVHVEGGWAYQFRHFTHSRSMLMYDVYEAGGYAVQLEIIRQVSIKLYKNLLRLLKLRPKFERVVKIKEGKTVPTFDLTMKNGKSPIFVGNGVYTSNSGGDFWKSTDFSDSVLAHKTRALGISEALLSGDSSYNTADASMTVFIEMLRSFREMFTRKLFYNKLFPLISMLNGYTTTVKGKLIIKDDLMNSMSPEDALFRMNDGSKLLIPTISWAKQLKPEGDTAYLDMLNTMTEKGVPVPIRVLAAAGGLTIEDLIRQQDDDLDLRKKISDYNKKILELVPKAASEDSDAAEASSLLALASADPSGTTRSAVHATGGKIALLNRNFGEATEVVGHTKTGKKKAIYNQSLANDRINKNVLRALKSADQRGAFKKAVVPIRED